MTRHSTRPFRLSLVLALAALAPALLGAKGGCGGAANSRSPAPDVGGQWAITYDDTVDVEVKIGGAVYTAEVGLAGGEVTIEHDGQPFTFDLRCERPEVVCPSEAWPAQVRLSQRNAQFPHRMFVTLPRQTCAGELVDAKAEECGEGTLNEDCEPVCQGEVQTGETDHFGVITEAGDHFDVLLGGGIATNGVNCAMLGVSVAKADLATSGTAEDGDWRAERMEGGQVVTAYAGGCLWAGDPDDDGQLEALVLSASVKFTTGFVGARQ